MIDITKTGEGHLKIVCTSEFEHLDAIVDETHDFLASMLEDEDLAYKIVLLLTEAITNAIEHGNESDHSKRVWVDIEVENKHVTVKVRDEGKGFDRSAVVDPTDTANLMRDGGRGIYFIEEMADEVHFSKGGSMVRIVFNR